VVSRSNEAKEIGVPMGVPYFKVAHLEKQKGLIARSSITHFMAICQRE